MGADNLPVEVVLKESSDKTIGESNNNSQCSIFYGSIEIAWDTKTNGYGMAKQEL
jgi:hypothetical protein